MGRQHFFSLNQREQEAHRDRRDACPTTDHFGIRVYSAALSGQESSAHGALVLPRGLPHTARMKHAAELPQKNDLCGAFWGCLALRQLGYTESQVEAIIAYLESVQAK